MNDHDSAKRILFVITKANWGGPTLETLGFPTLAPLGAFRHGGSIFPPTPLTEPLGRTC